MVTCQSLQTAAVEIERAGLEAIRRSNLTEESEQHTIVLLKCIDFKQE
jgi:hypothetical protein